MLQLKRFESKLEFSFPEVHEDARLEVSFIKTLRIPDNNKSYPLPAGLGNFGIEHVDDFAKKLPSEWNDRGGVMFPMYQSEAMWIKFDTPSNYPFAVKIASGKINVITGNSWKNDLSKKPQDYLVAPKQKWIDGFCVKEGFIRQFVATRLGEELTVEEQVTGKAENGGIQIIAYPMKKEIYNEMIARREAAKREAAKREAAKRFRVDAMMEVSYSTVWASEREDSYEMGLAQGGLMRQELYQDSYGFNSWDNKNYSRAFVHILNSKQWENVTGEEPHSNPITKEDYIANGIPWFKFYSDGQEALKGSSKLNNLEKLETLLIKKGVNPEKANLKNVHILNYMKKKYNI